MAEENASVEVSAEVAEVDAAIVENGGTVDERLDALEAENISELREAVEANDVELSVLQEKVEALESKPAASSPEDVLKRLAAVEARLGY